MSQKTYIQYIKILGLFATIAYMIIILYVWIGAEIDGYTYFSAGEPHNIIRYTEWFLGLIGIYTLISITKKELDKHV